MYLFAISSGGSFILPYKQKTVVNELWFSFRSIPLLISFYFFFARQKIMEAEHGRKTWRITKFHAFPALVSSISKVPSRNPPCGNNQTQTVIWQWNFLITLILDRKWCLVLVSVPPNILGNELFLSRNAGGNLIPRSIWEDRLLYNIMCFSNADQLDILHSRFVKEVRNASPLSSGIFRGPPPTQSRQGFDSSYSSSPRRIFFSYKRRRGGLMSPLRSNLTDPSGFSWLLGSKPWLRKRSKSKEKKAKAKPPPKTYQWFPTLFSNWHHGSCGKGRK